MLRRMFQNRVDVDNEYLLQHRVAGYPLYQYINMDRHGRLVDLYKDCTPCDEEEQKKRLKFIEKLETSMKEQEKEKQRDESQEESGEPVVYGHSEFAKSVYQQVAREHRRRKRWRQTDKTRVDDTLSEVIRRELKSCLYNDILSEVIRRELKSCLYSDILSEVIRRELKSCLYNDILSEAIRRELKSYLYNNMEC